MLLHGAPAFVVGCRRSVGRGALGRSTASTALSTGCEPGSSVVERAGPRRIASDPTITSFAAGQRRVFAALWRASHAGLRARWSERWRGTSVRRERNKPAGARGKPSSTGWRDGGPSRGLTLSDASAYRWPVTRCRPVPHVHEQQPILARGWAVPAEEAAPLIRDPVWTSLRPPKREAREQAYVPAEQPPPSQGARVPPAHAHPRRPLDPVLAPPQGPQEPRGLTAGPPPRPAPCCPRPTGSPTATSFRDASAPGRRAGSAHPGRPPRCRRGRRSAYRSAGRLRGQQGGGQRRGPQPGEAPAATPGPGARLDSLPGSAALVVRALPAAATASYAELARRPRPLPRSGASEVTA